MSRFIDLTGERFGRLVVLKKASNLESRVRWLCRCDCGKEKIVRGDGLRGGDTKSCGCLQKEKASIYCKKFKTKHGHDTRDGKSKTYASWQQMVQRCTNPSNKSYCNYGGRGITVCGRWGKFENFLEDMGEVPEGHQIDRIDNNGNYCKSNCRWATRKEQGRNKRNNLFITYKGKTQLLVECAEQLGVKYYTLWSRLSRGWSIERALTTPVKKRRKIK